MFLTEKVDVFTVTRGKP